MMTIKTRLFALADLWAAHQKRRRNYMAASQLDNYMLKDIGMEMGACTPHLRRR